MKSALRASLLSLAALALAACGGDDDVGEVIPELDLVDVAIAVESVANPVIPIVEPNQNLQNAWESLVTKGVVFDRAALQRPTTGLVPGSGQLLLLPVEIPDSLTGATVVYDLLAEDWLIDPDRTSAPEQAVRVIHYDLDRFGGFSPPLQEQGFIDIVEVVPGDEYEDLGITIVYDLDGSETTVAEYTHGYVSEGTSPAVARFRADGFYGDGDRNVVDFQLTGVNTVSEDQSVDEAYSFDLEAESRTALYLVSFDDVVSNTGGSDTQDLVASIAYGGMTVEVVVTSAARGGTLEAVSGAVRFNNEVVADIALENRSVVFLPPDGGSFSGAQVRELEQILAILGETGIWLVGQLPLLFD